MGEAHGAAIIKLEAKLTYYIILDVSRVAVAIKYVTNTVHYTNLSIAHVSTKI